MTVLAGFLGFMSTAFSAGSKTLNKKITKHEKTISIAEAKHLSVSGLFSKAIENNYISDIEFNLILHEIEQYKSLKRQLINKAKSSKLTSFIEVLVRPGHRANIGRPTTSPNQNKLELMKTLNQDI